MKTLTRSIMLALAIGLMSHTGIASAAPGKNDGAAVSEREAARIVRQQKGGKVLDVKRQNKNGRPQYRVKTIENGRVRVYGVDGKTGRVRE